jgi:biotin carboxyl carrier protein
LGTDGFGRSDFRFRLREHFEVNRHYIVVAAHALRKMAACLRPRSRGDQEVRYRRGQGQPAVRINNNHNERRRFMALVEVKVPDIGDFKEVEVIEVMVKPGDTIAVDQSLLTVESDKASMEISFVARWRW